MKNILFVIGSLHRAGSERVISILANRYCQLGYEVEIVMMLHNIVEYNIDKRVKIIDLSFGSADDKIDRILKIPRWIIGLRKIINKYNPSRVVAFTTYVNLFAILSSIGKNNRVIVSERTDPKMDKRRSKITQMIIEKLWRSKVCKTVVFQSEYAMKCYPLEIQNKGTVIGNPIRIYSERKKERNKIVNIGRLETQKNQMLLLKAFKNVLYKYPDVKLEIYGEGSLRQELMSTIVKEKLEGKVYLCGNVEDVHDRISDAKIFVLSSRYEGVSNALLEAMMIGLPCVCTKINAIDEIIEDGVTGVLSSNDDVDDLSDKICYLLGNESLRIKIGKAARREAERYKEENIIKEWEDIIAI